MERGEDLHVEVDIHLCKFVIVYSSGVRYGFGGGRLRVTLMLITVYETAGGGGKRRGKHMLQGVITCTTPVEVFATGIKRSFKWTFNFILGM